MGQTKRKLSSWNLFVMNLKKKHPEKSFKDTLKLASQLKKKGSNYIDFVQSKTKNVMKKINVTKKNKSKKGKKGKKGKTAKKH